MESTSSSSRNNYHIVFGVSGNVDRMGNIKEE